MKEKIFGKILVIGLLAATANSFAEETQHEHVSKENKYHLEKKELTEKHKKVYNLHELVWKKTDVNNDGKISKAEALAVASESFDNRDLDKDGFITKEETKKFYEEMRKKYENKKNEHSEHKLEKQRN